MGEMSANHRPDKGLFQNVYRTATTKQQQKPKQLGQEIDKY